MNRCLLLLASDNRVRLFLVHDFYFISLVMYAVYLSFLRLLGLEPIWLRTPS